MATHAPPSLGLNNSTNDTAAAPPSAASAAPSAASSTTATTRIVDLNTTEYVETRSVMLEWKVSNLKQLFEQSKGEAKSKCVKSALFDNHRWQIFLYPNSGHEQYCSLYLSCEPTSLEKELGLASLAAASTSTSTSTSASAAYIGPGGEGGGAGEQRHGHGQGGRAQKEGRGPWKRDGKFKFTFEVRSLERSRTLFKQMEATDWHSFSGHAPNWGYASFLKRSDAFFNNALVRSADAFLIVCTIVCSPTEPSPPPLPRLLIPKELVKAYASLFDDPDYSDVVFRIRPSNRPDKPERRLYAIKKVLAGRCEYFEDMFSSGFHESLTHPTSSSSAAQSTSTSQASPRRPPFSELHSHPPAMAEGEESFSAPDDDTDWDEDDDTDADEDGDDSDAEGEEGEFEFDDGSPEHQQSAETRRDEAEGEGAEDTEGSDNDQEEGDEEAAGMRTPERRRRKTTLDSSHSTSTSAFVDAPVAPDSPVKISHAQRKRGAQPGSRRPTSQDGGPPTTMAAASASAIVASTKKAQPKVTKPKDSRPRFEVIVTDAAYQSYRALLHYLYTDSITFAPLASTYHVAREAAQQSGLPFPYESRRAYLLANTHSPQGMSSGDAGVGPCSAKAIYRLADKIGLSELKERAFDHIVKSLTVQNIPYEVFGSFTSRFDEIKRVEIAFLLDRWSEAKAAPSMRKVFDHLRSGKYPGFEDVWKKIIKNLEYMPKAGGGSDED